VDWKLEVIVVPVADVDRSLAFYRDLVGFRLDVDHHAGNFRVVQMTPPGSACSITLMPGPAAPGALQGIQLVVSDIDAARQQLADRGVHVSDLFHFESGLRTPGHHPARADYGSFFAFDDPDGNGWLVQEVGRNGATG
jgi:catechol 2,3-dioxygenase-like lactoylglutathione lyase family enzyme